MRKPARKKELIGSDIFVHWAGESTEELGQLLSQFSTDTLALTMISNRGIKVWPAGFKETFCTDHWRCRFTATEQQPISHQEIISILEKAAAHRIDVIKTENLYAFDGKPAYSLGQGQ